MPTEIKWGSTFEYLLLVKYLTGRENMTHTKVQIQVLENDSLNKPALSIHSSIITV